MQLKRHRQVLNPSQMSIRNHSYFTRFIQTSTLSFSNLPAGVATITLSNMGIIREVTGSKFCYPQLFLILLNLFRP
jgi:hypothetical protein